MKSNKLVILFFLLITGAMFSCKKDSKDVSSTTTYPQVSLKGDMFMTIAKGSTYTEPGVTATIGGSAVPFTTTGTVDATVAGVYTLEYTAVNTEGFKQSTRRFVGVIDPNVVGNDFSGNYKRSSNSVMSHWTKISNGLYTTDNVGGVDPVSNPTFTYDVYVFNIKDSTMKIPSQPSALGGDVYCSNVIHSPSTGLGQIKYVVMGSGYGTSVRTFNKQ